MALPHLVLSGFMATGKTTVGRALSERASVPFVDTDARVVAAARASGAPVATVADVFTTLGEPTFRRLEAAALARALEAPPPTVIAVGGGALLDPESRARALAAARVVTLTAPIDTLLARLERGTDPRRPLLEARPRDAAPATSGDAAPTLRGRLEALLAARAACYAEAHATIATDDDGRSIEHVAEAVERAWRAPALVVPLGARSYPVRFAGEAEAGTLVRDILDALRPSSWFHVTDTTVEPLWRARFLRATSGDRSPAASGDRSPATGAPPLACVSLAPGEREKHLAAVEPILRALVDAGADRGSVVVAHGGGVVSDMAGFAAAILLRGVRWISVPTTLLSMADAAIGGKTGVDLGPAKNAIGSFHQPSAVVIDVRHVATETPRAFTSGLAEIAKAGAIADPALIALLERAAAAAVAGSTDGQPAVTATLHPLAAGEAAGSTKGPPAVTATLHPLAAGEAAGSTKGPPEVTATLHHRLSRDVGFLEEAVFRAAAVKARIVAIDERESGPRALLNFGHTLGHALEAAGGFERWTHGEAVALGIVGALRAGCALGLTPRADADRLVALLGALGLPIDLRRPEIEAALPFLALDKKRRGAAVRAVFLTAIGSAVTHDLPLAELARLYTNGA